MKLSRRTLMYVAALVACTSILLVFFLTIDPRDKSLPYIFIPVLLFWGVLFYSAQLLLSQIFRRATKLRTVMVFVVTTFLVLLVLLSGLGQLTLGDVVLTVCLAAVSTFYFYRSWG